MRADGLVKMLAGVGLFTALGVATSVQATDTDIPGTGFAGIAGNGNSGTDAFGQPWLWNKTKGGFGVPKGDSAWGNPGLGHGELTGYNGSRPATDFFISFLVSNIDAFINTTPSPFPGGYNESTRFDVCTTTCVEWTPVYKPSVDPLQVNFIAPPGSELVKGDHYFVNVVFTSGALSGTNAGFSAIFSSAIPEAPTWTMMILGLAAVGGSLRHARRRCSTALISG